MSLYLQKFKTEHRTYINLYFSIYLSMLFSQNIWKNTLKSILMLYSLAHTVLLQWEYNSQWWCWQSLIEGYNRQIQSFHFCLKLIGNMTTLPLAGQVIFKSKPLTGRISPKVTPLMETIFPKSIILRFEDYIKLWMHLMGTK